MAGVNNQVNLADIPNSITRDDLAVTSISSSNLAALTDDQLSFLITACQIRLMAELCITEIPTENVEAWTMLLANYVAAVFAANKSGIVATLAKQVRNFHIQYGNNGKIELKNFYSNFSDLIGMFSQCTNGVMMQKPFYANEDWPDGIRPGDSMPDWPIGRPF